MQIWYAVLLDIWYPNLKDKAGLKSVIAEARDHCGHLHAQSDNIEHVLYAEAAKRLGLSEHEIYFMIQPEIAEALRGKKMSMKKIQSRIKLCVESNHEGRDKLYEGTDAEKAMSVFAVPAIGPKMMGELKGTPGPVAADYEAWPMLFC